VVLSIKEANVNGIDDNTWAKTVILTATTAFQLQVDVAPKSFDVPHRVAAATTTATVNKSCSCHIGKSYQLDGVEKQKKMGELGSS